MKNAFTVRGLTVKGHTSKEKSWGLVAFILQYCRNYHISNLLYSLIVQALYTERKTAGV